MFVSTAHHQRHPQERTRLEIAIQVYPLRFEGAGHMEDRILDRIVLGHQVDKSDLY